MNEGVRGGNGEDCFFFSFFLSLSFFFFLKTVPRLSLLIRATRRSSSRARAPFRSRQFIGSDSHEPRLRVHKLTSRTSVGVLDSCCSLVLFAALAALSCWYCWPCCRLLVSTRSICSWHALKQSWNREITDVESWVMAWHLMSQVSGQHERLSSLALVNFSGISSNNELHPEAKKFICGNFKCKTPSAPNNYLFFAVACFCSCTNIMCVTTQSGTICLLSHNRF